MDQQNQDDISGDQDNNSNLKVEIKDELLMKDVEVKDELLKMNMEFENLQVKKEPVDISTNIPQQLNGRYSTGTRFHEQITAVNKLGKVRNKDCRYQQLKNRSIALESVKQNRSITDQDEVVSSKGAAKRLIHVITWMKDNGHFKILLQDFAHSATCAAFQCSSFCKMFKSVRRHVIAARHKCFLLRQYALLLRLHVNSCIDDNCGLQACPTLRASKRLKRPSAQTTASILSKRHEASNMIQNDKAVPNSSLHFTPPTAEEDGNPYVVVLAVENNKLVNSLIRKSGIPM